MTEKKKIDWAEGKHREHLIEARKFLWREDTVEMLANWLPLQKGMTMVDIGCGLGYNGWTYAPYFLEDGKYCGVDASEKLLEEAKELSKSWSRNQEVDFKLGDAYKLPFEDESADITICQTLLMHLKEPEKALQEMKRVTKSGGLIVCVEPDNLNSSIKQSYSSLPDSTIEEKILEMKVRFYMYEGHKKMGLGDYAIGSKIPKMMKEINLVDIDMRDNDNVYLMQFPAFSEQQKQNISIVRKNLDNLEKKESSNTFFHDMKKKIIAGGGSEYLYRKFRKMHKKRKKIVLPEFKKQIEKESLYICSPGASFYIIRGRKK